MQLCVGMIHHPSGRQLELLKDAEEHQIRCYLVGLSFNDFEDAKDTSENLRAPVPHVLNGHVGGMLQAEGVGLNNKATIPVLHHQKGMPLEIPRPNRLDKSIVYQWLAICVDQT